MARTSIFLCFSILAVSNQLVVTDLIPNSTVNSDIHESIEQYNATWRSVMELYNETNTVDPKNLVTLQNLINEKNNLTSSNLKSSLQNLYDVAKSIEDNYKIFEQFAKSVEQSPNSTNSLNKFLESMENICNSSSVINDFFKSDGILQSVLNKQLSIQNLTVCDLIVNLGYIIEVIASRNYVIQYTANYLKGNSEKCEEITRIYLTISLDITKKLEAAYSTASKSDGCE